MGKIYFWKISFDLMHLKMLLILFSIFNNQWAMRSNLSKVNPIISVNLLESTMQIMR